MRIYFVGDSNSLTVEIGLFLRKVFPCIIRVHRWDDAPSQVWFKFGKLTSGNEL